MGALTVGAILRAEHDTLKVAFDEWLGQGDKPGEDLMYIMGEFDLADKLINTMENDDAGKQE